MPRSPTIPFLAACLILPLVVLAGCKPAADSPLGPEDAFVRAGHVVQTAPVLSFADFSQVGGARLTRTPEGVKYRVETTGLVPGNAYTLWIIPFNHTPGCQAGTPGASLCGGADVVNDDALPDMAWAAGDIADGNGTVSFSGRRGIGDLVGSVNDPVGLPAYGLLDPFGAEFHFVVHDHGPMIPEFMPDMVTTLDGGCTDAGVPAPGVSSPWNDHEYGARGPNTCQSVQFAVLSP